MSLTLKSAIDATQTTIDVEGSDTLNNGDLYTIEDEQVFIVSDSAGSTQPGQTAWQRLTVQRGVLGTTEAAHDAGTAMTTVETPLGAGGGEQMIRLVEVEMDSDDPAWVGDPTWYKPLAQLTPGQVILDVWFTVTDAFPPDTPSGELMVGQNISVSGQTLAVWALTGDGVPNEGLLARAVGVGDETTGVLSRGGETPFDVIEATELAFVPSVPPMGPGIVVFKVLIAEPA